MTPDCFIMTWPLICIVLGRTWSFHPLFREGAASDPTYHEQVRGFSSDASRRDESSDLLFGNEV